MTPSHVPPTLFLDANVIFTATITPGGVGRTLFRLQESRFCTLAASRFVLDEAARNVRLKYPDRAAESIKVLNKLSLSPEPSPEQVTWAATRIHRKDAPVLAAAIGVRADVLVTGDRRHFGALFRKAVGGVVILSPREALEFVLRQVSPQ